jgi:O-acetyl-ADP-ribose deacetylase (regulator of RNase III)
MSKKLVDADIMLEAFQYMQSYDKLMVPNPGGGRAADGGLVVTESLAKRSKVGEIVENTLT